MHCNVTRVIGLVKDGDMMPRPRPRLSNPMPILTHEPHVPSRVFRLICGGFNAVEIKDRDCVCPKVIQADEVKIYVQILCATFARRNQKK